MKNEKKNKKKKNIFFFFFFRIFRAGRVRARGPYSYFDPPSLTPPSPLYKPSLTLPPSHSPSTPFPLLFFSLSSFSLLLNIKEEERGGRKCEGGRMWEGLYKREGRKRKGEEGRRVGQNKSRVRARGPSLPGKSGKKKKKKTFFFFFFFFSFFISGPVLDSACSLIFILFLNYRLNSKNGKVKKKKEDKWKTRRKRRRKTRGRQERRQGKKTR